MRPFVYSDNEIAVKHPTRFCNVLRLNYIFRFSGLIAAFAIFGCTPPAEPPAANVEPPKAAASKTMVRELPDFGSAEHVVTKAVGYGPSLIAAVDAAILSAIKQVNGQTMDASSVSLQQGVAVGIGKDVVQISSAGFAQAVSTRSGGAVTNFKLLSHEQVNSSQFTAEIEATVAKFKQPASASLPRLVVAPLRVVATSTVVGDARVAPEDLELALRQDIISALMQTNRFTVLDRDASAAVESELALIEGGEVQREDVARLGQALAADLILVGRIEQFSYEKHQQRLKTSDRSLTHYEGGARLTYRLINVSTRQMVATDTVLVEMPDTPPTTLPRSINNQVIRADLQRGLADQVSQAVLTKFFPITIAALEGDDVVLSQGGKMVKSGKQYRVYRLGQEIKDPQSGRSLGRIEHECCIIEVQRVTPELAYGRIVSKSETSAQEFIPGSLEVREEIAVVASAAQASAVSATPAPKTAPKKSAPPPASTDAAANDKDW